MWVPWCVSTAAKISLSIMCLNRGEITLPSLFNCCCRSCDFLKSSFHRYVQTSLGFACMCRNDVPSKNHFAIYAPWVLTSHKSVARGSAHCIFSPDWCLHSRFNTGRHWSRGLLFCEFACDIQHLAHIKIGASSVYVLLIFLVFVYFDILKTSLGN